MKEFSEISVEWLLPQHCRFFSDSRDIFKFNAHIALRYKKYTAFYFGFYDSAEKLAIVIGMHCFGIIEQVTGSKRNSTLLLSLFFIISLLIIAFTTLKKEESSPV